ncbi:MAG: mycofactocin-associated electron transfer flavoprotein alpha subunit [Actinomycetota bacterium]|jgi:electron transfer flavoprotein alpha subunit
MLAVIPVREGVLPLGGLETIAECGGRALLIGSDTSSSAELCAGIATEIWVIETPSFAPGAWAQALAPHLANEPRVVLPASPDGRDLAPRLASTLQRSLWAGALSVTPHHIELARNGGLVVNDIAPHHSFVATLQPGVRGVEQSPDLAASTAPLSALTFDNGSPSSADARVLEVLPPDVATMDLSESPRILGGGAGLRSADAFAQLASVASHLEASMGATRVITDRGWIGHDRQIGTTGVVVDPQLYIAFGISGAVQHTSGLGQPDHIISVNLDPHCPMMQLADLAIVSDANDVVNQLLSKLDANV